MSSSVISRVCSVDLASRSSACVVLDREGQVQYAFDSQTLGEELFLSDIEDQSVWVSGYGYQTLWVIEDVPAHVPFHKSTRDVCILQGRLVERLAPVRWLNTYFVQPQTWQKYHGLNGEKNKDAAIERAARFGLDLPKLVPMPEGRGTGALRAVARKKRSDYADAYLQGLWALSTPGVMNLLDVPGTTRYTSMAAVPATAS